MHQMNQQTAVHNMIANATQSSALGMKEPSLTSLANDLADALVSLRADILNLSAMLSPVCHSGGVSVNNAATAPAHPLSSLAQIQTLIEQVNGSHQDLRSMIDGLRV